MDWVALVVLTPLLGLSVVFVPLLIGMGFSLGTLSRMANDWTCPNCKAVIHTPDHIRHRLHMSSPHVTTEAW